MALSARFAVAVHTLGVLALAGGGPVSSERIAESVRTNAVTIRRLFQALGRAGLVVGQMGPNGGARLARPADAITLAEVWRAVEDGDLFAFAASGGNPGCAVSCAVKPVLGAIFDDAEAALEQVLAGVTLAAVADRVRAHAAHAAPAPTAVAG